MPIFKWRLEAATAAIVIVSSFAASFARAAYVVTLMQQGTNVVATGAGAIDLSGLMPSFIGGGDVPAGIIPDNALITVAGGITAAYSGPIVGPLTFGTGGPIFLAASNSSGSAVGIDFAGFRLIEVPFLYTSNSPLSSSSTYDNATFTSLGVMPGTYQWSWGTGANQSFTLKIGAAAVPDSPVGLPAFATVLMVLFGAKLCELRRFPRPAPVIIAT